MIVPGYNNNNDVNRTEKFGVWAFIESGIFPKCSCCGNYSGSISPYCAECGSFMLNVVEAEDFQKKNCENVGAEVKEND
jgi:hypothetical protein